MNGFKKFLLRGNVVDLAIGVVIGAGFTSIVNSLVKGLITPLIGVVGGIPDFSGFKFTINKSEFLIGDFINNLLSFTIMASVIYFLVVLPMNKLVERTKKDKPVDPTTKTCSECQSEIPVKAKRCAFCTSVIG